MQVSTKLIVFVSIHFLVLFTAFNAFQTIVTKLHEDQGDYTLGPFRLAISYSFFMISNLFVSNINCSEKWQITIATLTYVLQYSTGFFITGFPLQFKYIVSGLGAAVNGIGASFLWVSIGAYIHKICHRYQRMDKKGHLFGVFNTIFCLSTVLGAVVVTFGLSLLKPNFYFILVSSIAFLAFLYGIFFVKDIGSQGNQGDQVQFHQLNQKSYIKRAIQSAKSTLSYYPIMKYTLGLIILDGTSLGVVTSTMLKLLPEAQTKEENNLNAGFCLIFYGFGCVIGGYFGGKVTDWLKIKLSATLLMYVYFLVCLFSIYASLYRYIWSALVGCFFWGILLYSITSILMVICSKLYKGKPQSFAVVKQFHSFIFVIYQVIAILTSNQLPVWGIMLTLLCIGFLPMWGIYQLPINQDKIQKKQSLQQVLASSQ